MRQFAVTGDNLPFLMLKFNNIVSVLNRILETSHFTYKETEVQQAELAGLETHSAGPLTCRPIVFLVPQDILELSRGSNSGAVNLALPVSAVFDTPHEIYLKFRVSASGCFPLHLSCVKEEREELLQVASEAKCVTNVVPFCLPLPNVNSQRLRFLSVLT